MIRSVLRIPIHQALALVTLPSGHGDLPANRSRVPVICVRFAVCPLRPLSAIYGPRTRCLDRSISSPRPDVCMVGLCCCRCCCAPAPHPKGVIIHRLVLGGPSQCRRRWWLRRRRRRHQQRQLQQQQQFDRARPFRWWMNYVLRSLTSGSERYVLLYDATESGRSQLRRWRAIR